MAIFEIVGLPWIVKWPLAHFIACYRLRPPFWASLTRIQMHPRSPNIGSRPRAPAIKKPPINGGVIWGLAGEVW